MVVNISEMTQDMVLVTQKSQSHNPRDWGFELW